MILTSDYHTHTKYSHGKGTVLENAIRAKEIGLKEIAISDHGFSHPAFGLRQRKMPKLISDCNEAEKKGAEFGALIYPTNDNKAETKYAELYGYGGTYATIPIYIPDRAIDYCDFFNKMEKHKLKWDNGNKQISLYPY